MDNLTRQDILNVVGRPISGTPRTVFIILIVIVILIALIGFFLGSGYIQVGNPASPYGGNQGNTVKTTSSTSTTTQSGSNTGNGGINTTTGGPSGTNSSN